MFSKSKTYWTKSSSCGEWDTELTRLFPLNGTERMVRVEICTTLSVFLAIEGLRQGRTKLVLRCHSSPYEQSVPVLYRQGVMVPHRRSLWRFDHTVIIALTLLGTVQMNQTTHSIYSFIQLLVTLPCFTWSEPALMEDFQAPMIQFRRVRKNLERWRESMVTPFLLFISDDIAMHRVQRPAVCSSMVAEMHLFLQFRPFLITFVAFVVIQLNTDGSLDETRYHAEILTYNPGQ